LRDISAFSATEMHSYDIALYKFSTVLHCIEHDGVFKTDLGGAGPQTTSRKLSQTEPLSKMFRALDFTREFLICQRT